MERETIKHESFGQVSFSRISGRGKGFYGSDLPQDNYIELTIDESECQRDLIRDRFYPTKKVVSVRMTSGQFSELITTMNRGEGVPCTIQFANGKRIEGVPDVEGRKGFVHRKFQERMDDFAKKIKDKQESAKELIKKKTLSKDDVRDLGIYIDWLSQEISSNIPFFAECFQETMDKVVFEAKLEVENAIQHKIDVLGLSELKKEGLDKLLSSTNNDNQ